jgi:menaquinone-9 beta-reductase
VRKCFWDRGANWKRGMGFGLVAEAPLAGVADESLRNACGRDPHIFFGVLPWGYGWIFPRGESVSVGIGGLLGQGVEFPRTFRAFVDDFFQPEVWKVIRPRGHLFPFGNFERTPGRGNILLVGDAARFVEPVTGEGIGFALESGQLAASAAGECLARGEPSTAGRTYNALVRRSLLPHLKQARIGRWLLFSKLCFPIAMRSLRRHPRLVHYYLELVAGKLSYANYLGRMTKDFWSGR